MYFSLTWSLGGWELVQCLLLHRAAGSQQPASDPSQQGSRTAGTYRYTADPTHSTRPDQTEPLKTGQHPAWSRWLVCVYYRNYNMVKSCRVEGKQYSLTHNFTTCLYCFHLSVPQFILLQSGRQRKKAVMMPRVVLTPLKVNGEHVPSGKKH